MSAWIAGIIFVLHGLYSIIGDVLVVLGIVHIPEPIIWKWRLLDLYLWGPWWLLGGIFFTLAILLMQRSRRVPERNSAL